MKSGLLFTAATQHLTPAVVNIKGQEGDLTYHQSHANIPGVILHLNTKVKKAIHPIYITKKFCTVERETKTTFSSTPTTHHYTKYYIHFQCFKYIFSGV